MTEQVTEQVVEQPQEVSVNIVDLVNNFLSAIAGSYNAVIITLNEDGQLGVASNVPDENMAFLVGITGRHLADELSKRADELAREEAQSENVAEQTQ